jgi:hypothetical protein
MALPGDTICFYMTGNSQIRRVNVGPLTELDTDKPEGINQITFSIEVKDRDTAHLIREIVIGMAGSISRSSELW